MKISSFSVDCGALDHSATVHPSTMSFVCNKGYFFNLYLLVTKGWRLPLTNEIKLEEIPPSGFLFQAFVKTTTIGIEKVFSPTEKHEKEEKKTQVAIPEIFFHGKRKKKKNTHTTWASSSFSLTVISGHFCKVA